MPRAKKTPPLRQTRSPEAVHLAALHLADTEIGELEATQARRSLTFLEIERLADLEKIVASVLRDQRVCEFAHLKAGGKLPTPEEARAQIVELLRSDPALAADVFAAVRPQ